MLYVEPRTAPTSPPAPRAVLHLVQHGDVRDPDLDFEVVAVEGATEQVLGRSADAMVGRRMRILFPVAGLDPFLRDFAAVMASGETLTREAPTKLGVLPISWLWYQASRVGDRLQLEMRDLTALEESEERFRAAFDNAGSGMALVTRDGRNLRVNRALTTILGYSEAELLAITWKDVIHPDDLDASLLNWEQFDRHHALSIRSEKRYFHRDGHAVWVQVTISMVRDRAGNPLYFLAQVEDISERRRLVAALRLRRGE